MDLAYDVVILGTLPPPLTVFVHMKMFATLSIVPHIPYTNLCRSCNIVLRCMRFGTPTIVPARWYSVSFFLSARTFPLVYRVLTHLCPHIQT